jgi:rSAM/selenodomain-associated transferase 1
MTGRRIVYAVAKAPRPGLSKTRLSPPLSPDQTAELATAFLLDTLSSVEQAGCEARLICRTADEARLLQRLTRGIVPIDVQEGEGLGAALESAFRFGLDGTDAGVAVLGTDSPTLPPSVIAEAFTALERGVEVALGPCEDGGYYLLGARDLHPGLFRDMPWSTDRVAALTLARCQAAALATHVLPIWYDVDDAPSLRHLEQDLSTCPAGVAAATRAVLAGWRYGSGALHSQAPRSVWEGAA